jgi:hypothetical protein
MKLDPGMHIGMHLVSFGKPGVTVHGGPASSNEGVHDLVRSSQIRRPRTRASEGDGGVAGVRRCAAAASPAQPKTELWGTVSRASGPYA